MNYPVNNHRNQKPGDRIIVALIAAFLAYWLGGFIDLLAVKLFSRSFALGWWFAGVFAVWGYVAPSGMTRFWSEFFEQFLGMFSSRR